MATRQPFSAQSILFILLDYTQDRKEDLLNIHKALESTVVVGGGVVGGTRLPGVGAGVLGSPYSRLLPLTPLRGHLPAVLTSLNRILTDLEPRERVVDLTLMVQEALDCVVADAASFPPASQHPIQVVVLTWEHFSVVTEAFSLLLTHNHSRYLSAVHVAGLECCEGESQSPEVPPLGEVAGVVWVTGATYPPDPYTLTALFKSWLREVKGKKPHVHLTLSPYIQDKEPIKLLLDVQEMIIEPVCLPSALASRLTLQTNLIRTVSSTQGNCVNVWDVEVLKLVKGENVAAAVFGPPYYLLPTSATSLTFTEIWHNKQYVASVSEELAVRDIGLLAKVRGTPTSLTPLLAIFPAPHCSALTMVHLAPAELMLAERNTDGKIDEVPNKISKEVCGHLNSLEESELRLEDQESCLIPTLIHHLTRTSRGSSSSMRTSHGTTTGHQHNAAPTHRALPQHPAFSVPPSSHRGGSVARGRGSIGRRASRAHAKNR
ncbi:hypothetical protein Pmani_020285 [Petrolisthes manimaculis]|uniref:Uncharacterized protein n=1 Tax=Petrolisthes manimaculis TaxID=1843537 RepID=A0AAE1PIQ5_9EUCA|nr:hypothetical protein Pmani_020285 [Petrolisthes manimaculis]